MTLEEIVDLSSNIAYGQSTPDPVSAKKLAMWIIDNLAEAQPCGYERPTVHGRAMDIPNWGMATPEEARAMASMLLSAADEAEKS